jgi:hypothetical protein
MARLYCGRRSNATTVQWLHLGDFRKQRESTVLVHEPAFFTPYWMPQLAQHRRQETDKIEMLNPTFLGVHEGCRT